MSESLPRLELEKVFQSDASEISLARSNAILLHHTNDIDAAGDEVEQSVRTFFQKKLPKSYYVGQGHIVDANLKTSPQIDIILADNSGAPILFKSNNGTEYFPYESVYAIGEIKSSYYNGKKYVREFTETLDKIRGNLERKQTPTNYINDRISLGEGLTINDDGRPFRNPLFTFMLFVSSNDFKIDQIRDLYSTRPASDLPNILCFLDKGVVVNAKIIANEFSSSLGSINMFPEFDKNAQKFSSHWVFIPFGNDENRMGINLCFLYFIIASHLKSCILMSPDLLTYFSHLFSYEDGVLIT
jgi:hypothetical protein